MKGTEKQIKWAMEILEEAEKSLDCMLKNYEKDIALGDITEYIPEDVEAVREVLRKTPDNAGIIIDSRNRLTYDGLKKRVLAHARMRKEGKV